MIEIRNLTKSYGEKRVLEQVSFSIPVGQTTCVMGPSGCGKTTLLRILMGLEIPDGGTVTGLLGMRFSAVFQEDRLAENFSALKNVRMAQPKGSSPQDALAALAALGLKDAAFQPVNEMSGGMRRRTAILRALAAPWDVLFLDEPFKGLDANTKDMAIEYVRNQVRGQTVVMVSHDEGEAAAMGALVRRLPPSP